MFLFADFHVGLREIAPQNLPLKPGRLEKMGGWGTARSPDKVLSTQGPRKESQRGRGRQRAKGLRSRIWERREAEGGVYPKARGAKWVEPQILGTGAIPQAGGGRWRSRPESWCTAAPHQQRALGPQQFEVGGSQLPARCGKLDHGRLELYPSHCRPVGEGRGKKGWQGAKVVAEYPTSLPLRLPDCLALWGRSAGASRPAGAPFSDSQKSAIPAVSRPGASSARQSRVHRAGHWARRNPRDRLRRERDPALRALNSCVLTHTHTQTPPPCALSALGAVCIRGGRN